MVIELTWSHQHYTNISYCGKLKEGRGKYLLEIGKLVL